MRRNKKEIRLNLIVTVQKLGQTWVKFIVKYSASVFLETVPLTLKQLESPNQFKKLYKAYLISC